MKVSLIVYALNEIEGMRQIMPRIQKQWVDEILVIDGGSIDGTVEFSKESGFPVYRQQLPGWNGAYLEAHRRATGDILVDFSPDGNSIPEIIPVLIEQVKSGHDMAIASRYAKGARSQDDNFLTGFGNWMFTSLINLLFRAHYTDTLVIYRAYRKELVKECGLDEHPDNQFTPLICIRCAKRGKKVIDIPSDEPKRVAGESKPHPFFFGFQILLILFREFFTRR